MFAEIPVQETVALQPRGKRMFQTVIVSIVLVLAFALPANAEEKPGKSGPTLNLDLGSKKDGVGVKAKVDPKKKDNPLSSIQVQIGSSDKKAKSEKNKAEKSK